ncbi:hypothetical protein [Polaromonas sp. CG9_12]|nr:hypothetical protein [Polaromonas sp. CG9_12]
MLLFYAFSAACACSACAGSYLIGSGFRWLHLLAGGSPAASNFLLLRQKKVTKEKATRLSGSLRFASGNLRCPEKTGVGANSLRCATLKQRAALIPFFRGITGPDRTGLSGNKVRTAEQANGDHDHDWYLVLYAIHSIAGCASSICANGTFHAQAPKDSGYWRRAFILLRVSYSLSLWETAGVRAPRCRFSVAVLTPASPHPSLPPAGEGEIQARGKGSPDEPNHDKAQLLAPASESESAPASPVLAGPVMGTQSGIRAARCLSRRRVCADPRFEYPSQVARSEAQGPRQPGRLSFAYFSLAKQRKVSCRRATPGQQVNAEKAQAQSKNRSATNSIALSTRPATAKAKLAISSASKPAGTKR